MKDLKLFSLKIFLAFAIVLILTIWHNNNNTKPFKQAQGSSNCIFYDPSDIVITVKCKAASLRDIDNQLNDPNILRMESADGVWILNAGIVVDEGATLYINSSELSWLKMLTKERNREEGGKKKKD